MFVFRLMFLDSILTCILTNAQGVKHDSNLTLIAASELHIYQYTYIVLPNTSSQFYEIKRNLYNRQHANTEYKAYVHISDNDPIFRDI